MSNGNPNWLNLSKDALDPTTIGEEIAAQIVDHNDDADAHLGDGQALESHRAAEIIDHLAESVVNDKIQQFARSYVALVGTGIEGDFDTIQSAVAYADGIGGGTIFIAPGEYYLSGAVELPVSINFETADSETVIIHGGYTSGDYFKIVDDTENGQVSQTFSNINFINDGGGIFHTTTSDLTYRSTQYFDNCVFDGGGNYIYAENIDITMTNCLFYLSNVEAISTRNYLIQRSCIARRYSSSTTCILVFFNGSGILDNRWVVEDCDFNTTGATTLQYFKTGGGAYVWLRRSIFYAWDWNVSEMLFREISNCIMTGKNNVDFPLTSDGNGCIIQGSEIYPNGTGNIVVTDETIAFNGNFITGGYADIADGIAIYSDFAVKSFIIQGSGVSALGLNAYEVMQQTPTSTRTYTTLVPRAGSRRTLIILTSGTTSYTLTFGTGFKSTGTLATGATSARRFVINFVSDGTFLIETSRTVAIA